MPSRCGPVSSGCRASGLRGGSDVACLMGALLILSSCGSSASTTASALPPSPAPYEGNWRTPSVYAATGRPPMVFVVIGSQVTELQYEMDFLQCPTFPCGPNNRKWITFRSVTPMAIDHDGFSGRIESWIDGALYGATTARGSFASSTSASGIINMFVLEDAAMAGNPTIPARAWEATKQ